MPHFPHFNCDQILRPPRGFREAVTVTRFPGKLCGCFASSDRRSPFLGIQTDRRRVVGEAFGIAWLPDRPTRGSECKSGRRKGRLIMMTSSQPSVRTTHLLIHHPLANRVNGSLRRRRSHFGMEGGREGGRKAGGRVRISRRLPRIDPAPPRRTDEWTERGKGAGPWPDRF